MKHPDGPDKDRNYRTRIPESLWEEYYFALGKFMHMFGRLENSLNALVGNFAGARLRPQAPEHAFILKAVLGGQRLSVIRDTLKRLLRVTKAPEHSQKRLKEVFDHLGEIHYLRDRIAHNSAVPDMRDKDGWIGTANSITVRELEELDTIYFKPSMLLDAAHDLNIAPDLISMIVEQRLIRAVTPETATWRYKPAQLRREGPRYRRTPEPQKRPQQPSRPSRAGRRRAAMSARTKK